MSATVREKKKGSGIWWVFLRHKGSRKSKKVGDKKTAEQIAKTMNAKIALEEFGLNNEPGKTFGEYARVWRDTVIPVTCKQSTQQDYKSLLKKHILPHFGKMEVAKIKKLTVKEFLLAKMSKYAKSTTNHMKNAIGQVLTLAVDEEAITINPAHNLGKIFIDDPKKRKKVDFLTRDELSILLDSFLQHYPEHYPMTLTLARTGMRIGEVIALQWGDIDFNERFFNVQRNCVRGVITTPKSAQGTRRVDMSLQLAQVLKNLKHQRKIAAMGKGAGKLDLSEFVFLSTVGTIIIPDKWRTRYFYKALDKAGIRKIRIHDLRHTYASLLIQAGESLAYVKEQLGHHSIQVTVDVYGHLIPGKNKDAVDKLDDTGTQRHPYGTQTKKGLSKK